MIIIEDAYLVEDVVCAKDEVVPLYESFIRDFFEGSVKSYHPPLVIRGSFVGDVEWNGVFVDSEGNIHTTEYGTVVEWNDEACGNTLRQIFAIVAVTTTSQ